LITLESKGLFISSSVRKTDCYSRQHFKGRTIEQVLKQAADWKSLLKKDFILSLSPGLKTQVERFVVGTELLLCRALMEASAKVGPWDLRIVSQPSGHDEQGRRCLSIQIAIPWQFM